MTISLATRRNDYTGNGATSIYAYGFKIFSASDLVVTKADTSTPPVETPLVLTTDFTVDPTTIGNQNGGNITLVAGSLPNGFHLTITGKRPLTQTLDIRNQGEYFPETLEDEYDMLVMIAQQLQEQLNRAVLFNKTSLKSGLNMDDPVGNNFLVFDPTGTRITSQAGVSAGGTAYSPPANGFSSDVLVQNVIDKLNPRIHGSRATPISIAAAANAIATDSGVFAQTWYVKGGGGPVDLTGQVPPIKAGTIVGQRLRLVGCDDTNTLTLPDDPANGIVANGARVLEDGTVIDFEWNGTSWCEASFNNL